MVTDAVVTLVQGSGLQSLTMRAIARHLRMNPGIVNQWFGDRAAMLKAVTYRLGARRLHWLPGRLGHHGVTALLPPLPGDVIPLPWGPGIDEHDDAMAALRTWLALVELARSTPSLAHAMAEVRGLERDLVVAAGLSAPEHCADLFALLDGLGAALFPPTYLALGHAHRLLIDFARTRGAAA